MSNAIDTAPSAAAPSAVAAPAVSAIGQPRMRPASRRGTTSTRVEHLSPTRSALAEIVLAHGQLEVVAARLALLSARTDVSSSRMDILDAAHQTQRALVSVRHARTHIDDATSPDDPDTDDQSDRAKPSHWFG